MPFTLPASTGAASLTDAATTEAQQKTNFSNMRGFIAEMLGTDSTSRDTARSLLGIDQPTLTFSVASSALTINLKTPAGADATAAAPLTLAFRSATLTSGALAVRKLTAAASLVVSSGSTLGTISATDAWLYIYALDNAGTIELAISGTYYGEHFIGSSSAEGGAGAADTRATIYSTTARSSVAMRLLAAVRSNQTTAGTWAAVPVECRLADAGGIANLGQGQTWQSVTRVNGTTYYNTTGRPIVFQVTAIGVTASNNYPVITVDGITAGAGSAVVATANSSASAIIPPGAAYSWTISGGSSSSSATELR